MQLLNIRFSAIDESNFIVNARSGAGQAESKSSLPFYETKTKWRTTLIKILEIGKFALDKFSNEEKLWMAQEGLLLSDGSGFNADYLEKIGRSLYKSLFPSGEVSDLLQRSIALAEQDRNPQLHIQIEFNAKVTEINRLPDYPWEMVHNGQNFLAHHNVTFSRYIAYLSAPPVLSTISPINVLLVSSDASDEENGLAPLSKKERQAVRKGLEKGQIDGYIHLSVPSQSSFKELMIYLTEHRGEDAPHVLHFDGHGVFGKRCLNSKCHTFYHNLKLEKCTKCHETLSASQGYLLFESDDEELDANYVGAEELGSLLQSIRHGDLGTKQGGIRLVVLSACKSAYALGGNSVFNGVAQSLIGHGVPAVVAMQYTVSTKAATAFAERFYRELGNKQSLAVATSQGRVAMQNVEHNQWYRLIFYMRWQANDGGYLFNSRQEPFTVQGRSLVATPEGIKKVEIALNELIRILGQKYLAEKANKSLSIISHFFNNIPIERLLFIRITEILNLGWQEICTDQGRMITSTEKGLETVEIALIKILSKRLNVLPTVIVDFFFGKYIDGNVFIKICNAIKINWQEICTEESKLLVVNLEGIKMVQVALTEIASNQLQLTENIDILPENISDFFSNKFVYSHLFMEICETLGLYFQEAYKAAGKLIDISPENNKISHTVLNQIQSNKNTNLLYPNISNFFHSKNVDSKLFIQICEMLNLNWQEICMNKERYFMANLEGITKAKIAIGEELLAVSATVIRSTIRDFLDNIPIESDSFIRICNVLNLNYQEICTEQGRVLVPTLEGVEKAKIALTDEVLRSVSQKNELNEKVTLSKLIIRDFFRSIPVKSSSFIRICNALNLNYQEICMNQGRVLVATLEGVEKAEIALKEEILISLSREKLFNEKGNNNLTLSRSIIRDFFHYTPIESDKFAEICNTLNLKWQEICSSQGKTLTVTSEGIKKAEMVLMDELLRFINQGKSLNEKGDKKVIVSVSILNDFFRRVPIESNLFVQISKTLNLNWKEICTNQGISLIAGLEGLKKAEISMRKEVLAEKSSVTSSVIKDFFSSIRIESDLFVVICDTLKIKWQEISWDANPYVDDVRLKCKNDIQVRCGTMRVLEMTEPIGLGDIYTSVNILEKITGNSRKGIIELLRGCKPEENLEDFYRFGMSRTVEERITGIEAVNKYDKLMILGKPGAGKTTFLKYLALQCNAGKLQGERVPIFVTLKEFAEDSGQPSLLSFIENQWHKCKINNKGILQNLLEEGRCLILLDGLDEVKDIDTSRILNEIKDLADQMHGNHFVMTCRIASKEYTFTAFTEVEIADFDDNQIEIFSRKWFERKSDLVKAKRFIQKLKENNPIRELATNPLLLTLLCLVFEDSGDFTQDRSELYKEGLYILLKKWDGKRNIERDQIKLSIKQTEDLLSQVALRTFERNDYFFKQKQVEEYITDYIRNLPETKTNPEALHLDSESILKLIEANYGLVVERARGIYSFSHLTFQEYFTARRCAANKEGLQKLVTHVTEKSWREVFLLTICILQDADETLLTMKRQIDQSLSKDSKLQEFISFVNQKSISVKVKYKSSAVRAFYFLFSQNFTHNFLNDLNNHKNDIDLALKSVLNREINRNFDRVRDFDKDFDRDLSLSFERAITLGHELNIDFKLGLTRDLARDLTNSQVISYTLEIALDFAINFIDSIYDKLRVFYRILDCVLEKMMEIDSVAYQPLRSLINRLPAHNNSLYNRKQWWEKNGNGWINGFRRYMIEYHNIGHDWQFSDTQVSLLQQYYDANKLLVDCLNSDCYVSQSVRQEIEDTLLLTISSSLEPTNLT